MRALVILLSVLLLVSAVSAFAERGSTGLGVMVGSPNGITGRTWFDEVNSIDYGLGWNLFDSKKFQMHADYLWNRPGLIDINGEKFNLYFGAGLSFRAKSGKHDNELVFGPRIPVGVSYEFANPDLELFAETAINVGIIPSSDVYFDANVGARFYLF